MEQQTTNHKDCAGREICIGDKVATTQYGYTSSLVIMEVIGSTSQKIKLACPSITTPNDATYASHPDAYDTVLKFPEQTCLVR